MTPPTTPDTELARHARSSEPSRYARFLNWQEHAEKRGLTVHDNALLDIMKGRSMPKELRISVTITVPDDAFEQAQLLGKIDPACTTFGDALSTAVGAPVTVQARIVNPVVRTKKTTEPAVEPVVAHPHHRAA